MSLSRDAARGALVTLVGQWARFGVQLLSAVVMAHLLPPSDFGLVVMVTAVGGIAQILGDFGFGMATIQAPLVTRAQRSNVFWLNVALGVILAGIVYVGAHALAAMYHDARIVGIARVISIVFFLNSAASQFRSELSRNLRFTWVSIADLAGQVVALALGVVMALTGFGYWALVAQPVALASVVLVIVVVASGFVPQLPNRSDISSLFRFGRDNMIVLTITYVCQNIDTILLGRNFGSTIAGIYGKAYQLIMLPLFQILAPLSRVVVSVLSRVEEKLRFQQYVERIYLLVSYTLTAALAVLGAVVFPFVEIVLGPQWNFAARIIQFMLLGGVFETLSYPCTWIFLSRGRANDLLRATLATRPIMVLLIIIAAQFGAVQTSLAVAIGFVLNWLAFTFWGLPRVGVEVTPILRIVARPFLVYGIMLAVLSPIAWAHGVWAHPWLQLGVVLTCAAGFNGVAYLALPFYRRDLRTLVLTLAAGRGARPASPSAASVS